MLQDCTHDLEYNMSCHWSIVMFFCSNYRSLSRVNYISGDLFPVRQWHIGFMNLLHKEGSYFTFDTATCGAREVNNRGEISHTLQMPVEGGVSYQIHQRSKFPHHPEPLW